MKKEVSALDLIRRRLKKQDKPLPVSEKEAAFSPAFVDYFMKSAAEHGYDPTDSVQMLNEMAIKKNG